MGIAQDVHVIEHRRVQGGDWLRVQTVGDDMLEWAQEVVAGYNGQSGCGDWRIRTAGSEAPQKVSSATAEKPTIRQRLRWRWIMLTSKRGRR